jgi:hypothetical protein
MLPSEAMQDKIKFPPSDIQHCKQLYHSEHIPEAEYLPNAVCAVLIEKSTSVCYIAHCCTEQ